MTQKPVTSPTQPPEHALAITPNDSADLAVFPRALMVGTAGDVAVVMLSGDAITLPGLVPGVQYAAVVRRVKATGTTATGIIGLA